MKRDCENEKFFFFWNFFKMFHKPQMRITIILIKYLIEYNLQSLSHIKNDFKM